MGQVASGDGGGCRERLPLRVLLFTAGLAAAGVTGALLIEAGVGQVATPSWPAMLAFLVLLAAAGFPTLQFHWRDQGDAEDLFEAVLVPALFVLPPLEAVLVIGAAQALSETVQRIHPVKASFNVAQWMAATAVGSLVLAACARRRHRRTAGTWSRWPSPWQRSGRSTPSPWSE